MRSLLNLCVDLLYLDRGGGDGGGAVHFVGDNAVSVGIFAKNPLNLHLIYEYVLIRRSIRIRTTTTKGYQTKINATPSARFRTARSHRKLIRHLDSSYLMKVSQLLISRSRALMIQSSPNLPCFLCPS